METLLIVLAVAAVAFVVVRFTGKVPLKTRYPASSYFHDQPDENAEMKRSIADFKARRDAEETERQRAENIRTAPEPTPWHKVEKAPPPVMRPQMPKAPARKKNLFQPARTASRTSGTGTGRTKKSDQDDTVYYDDSPNVIFGSNSSDDSDRSCQVSDRNDTDTYSSNCSTDD